MRYRLRSVGVEAVQWLGTEESWAALQELAAPAEMATSEAVLWIDGDTLRLRWLSGADVVTVEIGDWLMRTGILLYSLKGDLFERIYEPVVAGILPGDA